MAEAARRRWTLEEFLAFDDGTDRRYELFDGEIVAMAPTSDVHGALVARLAVRIGAGLRPPCEVVIEAGIVPPERADSWYEADLAVTCAGLSGRQFVAEPVLLVEVLSPSTAATDRDRKLPDYRRIASLQDILVVSSTEPREKVPCTFFLTPFSRRAFYQRLRASGKAPKLALTAAMRKLLVILNAMLRDGTSWNPHHLHLFPIDSRRHLFPG